MSLNTGPHPDTLTNTMNITLFLVNYAAGHLKNKHWLPSINSSARYLNILVKFKGSARNYLHCTQEEKKEWKMDYIVWQAGGKKSQKDASWSRKVCAVSYLTLCDMCRGVSISSKMAPFTFDPLRLASCRSQPDKSQFCKMWQNQWILKA